MTRLKRVLVPLAVVATLSACAEKDGVSPFDSLIGPRADYTDLAYAALARGDYPAAARRAAQALERDADNARALFAQGVALEYTDATDQARALYQRLAAMPAAEQAMIGGGWTGARQGDRSIADLARARLASLGVRPATPLMPVEPPAPAVPAPAPSTGSAGTPATAGLLTGPDAASAPDFAPPASDLVERQAPPLSGIALLNAAERFRVLEKLLQQDLIGESEYARRRSANVGALLPYSTDARPAEGLGQAVPTAEQVMMRLEALRRTLAAGALAPEEHAAERRAILDAILPADPVDTAPPPAPPLSMADAAERADALQRLRDLGVISATEYARERKALEAQARTVSRNGAGSADRETLINGSTPDRRAAAAPTPPPTRPARPADPADRVLVPQGDAGALAARRAGPDARGRMMGQEPTVTPDPVSPGTDAATPPRAAASTDADAAAAPAGGVVLHLASYRDSEQAREGWTALRRRYPEVLSGLDAQLGRVDLGPGKGTYWRLNAGPVASAQQAEVLCGRLEALGQYCKTAFPDG
ncbi:SPOR domain-containing protein [Caenispirillum salinarum]|uniref:SPOR domain-containing protein n=1 Tax=Caenispirillum salinarum TaxID=859058 RepID=UPI00385120CB